LSSQPQRFSAVGWIVVVLAVLLAPVAVLCAGATGWGPGTLALVLQTVPVGVGAWTGNRRVAIFTVAVAALTCLFEGGFGWGHNRQHDWAFAMFAIGLLVALSGSILGFSDPLGRGVFVGESPFPGRGNVSRGLGGTAPASGAMDSAGVSGRDRSTEQGAISTADLAVFLLALQEVVRRLVADLDPQSLPKTIVETTCQLLAADEARVGFWNATTRELRLHGPQGRVEVVAVDGLPAVVRWVLTRRQAALRGDPMTEPELTELMVDTASGARGVPPWDAVLPLLSGGELLGVLLVRGVSASPRQQRLLTILANVAALAWRNATLFARIEEMGRRDGLTGLLTHAAFFEAAAAAVGKAEGTRWAVLIGDADRFKEINDRHGHLAGDAALRMMGHVWRTLLPASALAGRYGGEEFVALIPDSSRSQAEEIAEAIRAQVELSPVGGTDVSTRGGEVRVTLCVGVAVSRGLVSPGKGESLEAVVARADAALYRAKAAGRNLVRVETE
jgi:diguanylate cyclase (GGDEF)-like protein